MFILIGKELHTLPYAVELSATSIEEATAETGEMVMPSEEGRATSLQGWFIIDMEAKQIYRMYATDDKEMKVTDARSAFDTLGINSGARYFEQLRSKEAIR